MMLGFQVQDMTFGHRERAITEAVQALDPGPQVAVDRPSGRVSVKTVKDAEAIRQAIEDEGYRVS